MVRLWAAVVALLALACAALVAGLDHAAACQGPGAGTGAPPAATARPRPPRRATLARAGAGRGARDCRQGRAARSPRGRGGGAARAARGADPVAVALARRERGADVDAAVRVAMQQSASPAAPSRWWPRCKQADERLARYNQPRLERVRRAIARDLDRVKARGRDRHCQPRHQARRSGAHGRRAAAAVAGRARGKAPRPAAAARPRPPAPGGVRPLSATRALARPGCAVRRAWDALTRARLGRGPGRWCV